MASWDNRERLDCCLYDYFVKRNMHETAKIFKNEANLPYDHMTRVGIDTPEGFLREWWRTNFEFESFRAWMHENYTFNKAPSTKGKRIFETRQESNASQPELYRINVQRNWRAPDTLARTTGRGRKSIESVALNGIDNVSQGFIPSSSQENLTSTPANADKTKGQKVESSALATSRAAITSCNEEPDPVIENLLKSFWVFEQDQAELHEISMLGERCRNMKNLRKFEEENTGMRKRACFSSQSKQNDDSESIKSDASSNM
ncbi:hypothetical protein L6164_029916 [Bauhinia variegata]|uniref:Uncharacterized protein n=1 Tax=Bauhinia variegata TaxID=167791 RepID=A0ACB9LC14_BAUVA|nr:hypothetical protein L6164_029916 [Bauhinia variegata]